MCGIYGVVQQGLVLRCVAMLALVRKLIEFVT